MRQKMLFLGMLALTLAVSAAGIRSSWACSSMGPDKHLGVVKAINTPEGALVLVDAETGKPIQFIAPAKLLEGIKVNDKAVVTFKMEGEKLLAKEIVLAKG